MSLTTRKSRASVIALSLIALVAASCASEQRSPTSPSGLSQLSGINNVVTEYWVTMADETPAPVPAPVPVPAPDPAPVPPPPAPAPIPGPGGLIGAWPPGPPPAAAPGVPVPTPPSNHPRVSFKIDPEPVGHSGRPITDVASCRILPHTWYYDLYLHAETGVPVVFTERENFFDGRFTGRSTQTIQLAGTGTVILHVRWCSGYPKFHYTQHRFKGRDDYGEPITINSPWVRLYAP